MSDEIFVVNHIFGPKLLLCESSIGKINCVMDRVALNCLHRMCIQGLHSQKLAWCATDFDNFSANYWRSLLTYWLCVY